MARLQLYGNREDTMSFCTNTVSHAPMLSIKPEKVWFENIFVCRCMINTKEPLWGVESV